MSTPYDDIPIEVRRESQGWFGEPWPSGVCYGDGRLIEARYEVIAGSRKADGADGFFAALEHLDLCEPEEFYGDTLPEAIGRAHAWAVAKGPLR